ncbi:MAG: cation:dicarboxylase symporter family transporter [Bacteroidota bacterium]
MQLYTKILIGMVAGILVGALYNLMYDKDQWDQWNTDTNEFITWQEYAMGNVPEIDSKGIDETHQIYAALQKDWQNIDVSEDKLTNENGKIEKSEYEAWVEKTAGNSKSKLGNLLAQLYLTETTFVQLNEDQNYVLTFAEFTSGATNIRLRPEDFVRADRNQDSLLTLTEFQTIKDPVLFEGQFASLSQGKGAIEEESTMAMVALRKGFDKMDKNKDGKVKLSEYKAVYGWQYYARFTDPIGDIFIRLVKMLVVPLVLVSLILGAASLGDIRRVGKIGAKAFGFFFFTTAVAAMVGIGTGNLFRPGDGLPPDKTNDLIAQYEDSANQKTQTEAASELKESDTFDKIINLIVRLVPTNPFASLSSGDMLGIIFFALFLGITITLIPPEKAAPIIKAFDGLNDAVIKMVTLAMETAPYGVFALMLSVVSTLGLDVLLLLVKYAVAVLAGLVLHIIVTHFNFIIFYLRKNPLMFLQAIKEALIMAFSTSSSSATLPISLNVAQANLGVSRQVSTFILPLGATINMDGTAVYQAVAALFIAQVFEIPLDFTQQLTIILTATLASVGAAGVPGAGMITLALVLTTLGVPETGIALIFGLDRILDMCRTIVNVIGDLTLSTVIAKSEGENLDFKLDKDIIPG